VSLCASAVDKGIDVIRDLHSVMPAGPSTPKAEGLFSPAKSYSARATNYPFALEFSDKGSSNFSLSSCDVVVTAFIFKVPIYDGRRDPIDGPGFEFRAPDFDNIKSLPLFRNGKIDLPPYAVVTVGYSMNSYTYSGGTAAAPNSLALGPNILFVILLGIPEM
jgi:hypothetical protein